MISLRSLPRSRRLRAGRFSAPGHVYLVTTCVRQREPVFRNFHNGRALVRTLMSSDAQHLTRTLCFVVMPDHLHWLFQLNGVRSLSQVVRLVKGRSSRWLPGLDWQTGYHDRCIRGEENLRAQARYVVMNPLRAGLVRRLGDYPLWDACWLDQNRG